MGSGQVAAVRRFNRFYTRRIGVLDRGYLQSPFSLAEVRVLYELANRPAAPTASELCADLALDAGYFSRMVRSFERRGLVSRARSAQDSRRRPLALTPKGRRQFEELDRRTNLQVGG